MNRATIRWCGEYLFVFVALILIKSVLFPFVLWWWFAASDLTATLQEATHLVFSVITVFILLGMGSISRFRYRLSLAHTVVAYVAINLPFVVLSLMPYTRHWVHEWWEILGDGLQLWMPAIANMKGILIFGIGLLLTLVGRFIYVRDDQFKHQPTTARPEKSI